MDLKKIAICALLCMCFHVALAQETAPEQSSRESVMKFFAVANVEKQVQQVQDMMMVQATNSTREMVDRDPKLTPEQKQKILDSFAPEIESFRTLYPVSEMLQDMVPVYQRHFSESDLQAIIAFLQSPVGQKMLNEAPHMMQESMTIIMPKLNARMQTRMGDMQKKIESNTGDRGATPSDSKPMPKKN